jgi:two-component system C4-dicarboxylate transport response regulator DctD
MYASSVPPAQWVLVVDDDEDNRDSVVDVLQGAGYVANAAPGGTAALRMMGRSAPAVVVSDLRMPGMDGRELLTRTRQLLGASAPPFVCLTGLAPEFADAAATFVSKPCDFDQLFGVVGRHCRA